MSLVNIWDPCQVQLLLLLSPRYTFSTARRVISTLIVAGGCSSWFTSFFVFLFFFLFCFFHVGLLVCQRRRQVSFYGHFIVVSNFARIHRQMYNTPKDVRLAFCNAKRQVQSHLLTTLLLIVLKCYHSFCCNWSIFVSNCDRTQVKPATPTTLESFRIY